MKNSLFDWRTLLVLVCCASIAGCASTSRETKVEQQHYRSLWSQLYPQSLATNLADNSLPARFYTAMRSRDTAQAKILMNELLADFDPADGFFEDAVHARFVQWTKMELLRLQHTLSGDDDALRRHNETMRQYAKTLASN